MAVDPAGQWLYVVNSNSDLRFNAGTVVALNLSKATQDRINDRAQGSSTAWGVCPNSIFVQPQNGPANFCCHDYVDHQILNCDERAYVDPAATVRIGSFGGTMAVQRFTKDGQDVRRLFVSVRAEPSLTFIDVAPRADGISMSCTPPGMPANSFCTDDHRIKTGTAIDGTALKFQEEPHPMVLDDTLKVLFVGHLGGVDQGRLVARGVSVIDVCSPDDPATPPRLASILENALPGTGAIGVTDLARAEGPTTKTSTLYASAELTSDIAELKFSEPEKVACGTKTAPRDLTLAAGHRFPSAAFGSRGADLRGVVVDHGGERVFVLHRQYSVRGEFNPPSVVAINRRPDAQGVPLDEPIGVVEVCNGPNRLLSHDAGQGARLYVNCFENGQIYVIDPELLNVEDIIEVGTGPAELVFSDFDPTVAFVAGFANNNVSVLDLKPGSPTQNRVVQRLGFARPTAVPK
jgi:YVTN family beta-propeller protein